MSRASSGVSTPVWTAPIAKPMTPAMLRNLIDRIDD